MTNVTTAFPLDAVTVVDKTVIDEKAWEPLRGLKGVNQKVLCNSGRMIAGLVRVEPGAEEPGHVHHDAEHHVYVLDGSARIAGKDVSAGGFVFVPAGVQHATTEVGPEGCTFFYTFLMHH
jgi:Mannose-6-phosphate isomerase